MAIASQRAHTTEGKHDRTLVRACVMHAYAFDPVLGVCLSTFYVYARFNEPARTKAYRPLTRELPVRL